MKKNQLRLINDVTELNAEAVEAVSLSDQDEPTEDFRVLVSNLQSIEEVMTAKAKTLSQKIHLLFTWQKLKSLLVAMTDRLEKDIEQARQIEARLAEAKERMRTLQMKNGYLN